MTSEGKSVRLQQALEKLNHEVEWTDPDARFSVVETTHRRQSTLYVVEERRGSGARFFVKNGGAAWDSISAGEVAAAMSKLLSNPPDAR